MATRFPPGADPALVALYAEVSGKADPAAMIASACFCATLDDEPALPRVRIPLLGLTPAQGLVTGPHEARLRAGLADLRIIHLPTPNHAIQVRMPDACVSAVWDFCLGVDRGGAG
jgi:hypothetical protein